MGSGYIAVTAVRRAAVTLISARKRCFDFGVSLQQNTGDRGLLEMDDQRRRTRKHVLTGHRKESAGSSQETLWNVRSEKLHPPPLS